MRRWRDTRSRKGRLDSIREITSDIWDVIKEATPERRRALFGDVEYDWEHEVNTTSGAVSQRTRLLAAIAGAPYQPSEPNLFGKMLSALTINFEQFTFIDIGSGKGRTLLMAAEWPFPRIIGVELLPELHQVAVGNIGKSPHKDRMESLCLDGRDYQFPPDPLVVYLFNPLPAAALGVTVENLKRSLQETPRPLRIIYQNPTADDVLAGSGFLKKISSTHQYSIYSN
ncbi:MAG TPA: class I SAM-dependent methyltransferase [Terriglobales bacterium]|nr:class I SAM-dependent methyltransferase [Terriglobales bacterium]